MKRSVCVFLLFLPAILFGQNVAEIKNSGKYVWGYGEANTFMRANKQALSHLVGSISVEVQSSFESIVTEVDGEVQESVKSCINTYSSTSLQNTQQKTWEEKGKQCVFRYILKKDLDKIFSERAVKIKDYFKTGNEAHEQARFGDAMKNYYWSLLLLRSHPENQTMSSVNTNGEERKLITAIPDKIQTLLTDLDIRVQTVQYKNDHSCMVTLDASMHGKPVENIDYIYDLGGGSWSPLQSGRDGMAVVKLFGESADNLEQVRLRVEYLYAHKAQVDRDVFAIIENDEFEFPLVDGREFVLDIKNNDTNTGTDQQSVEQSESKYAFGTTIRAMDEPKSSNVKTNRAQSSQTHGNVESYNYQTTIPEIVEAIRLKKYDSVKQYFTTDGYQVFTKLVRYGNAEPTPFKYDLKKVTVNDETFIRSIPMRFSFPNNNHDFLEKLVFVLDQNGKVTNLNFAISDNAIHHLTALDERFGTEEEKFQLINFMEVYKTSYCLKRIEFIDSLFADNALIIVGRKVKKDLTVPKENIPQPANKDEFEFVQKTKGEYIQSLRRVFASSEFVNIHFEDNKVIKANRNDKLYGIQIAQHYTSSSYADKGYLFLMVDLENLKEPKIYVRSWQPEKRADGSVIGVSDFIFN